MIEYYSEQVQEQIASLPKQLKARYIYLTETMQQQGANSGEPHTKSLRDGLFELRIKAVEGIARAFYCTLIGQRIVILPSFIKKTDKIPKKELALACRRLKEVKAYV